ncbi:hypothetical protein B296_00001390 [Ensete ventricosum]|uniref:Uncharacterized protein n=1 Tax=Ensete ventricosum TaxID=4639 RepID=A0A427AWS5_ENSVE|nr:hypothetical protein B296_00001390 [Ensete ventricosum]
MFEAGSRASTPPLLEVGSLTPTFIKDGVVEKLEPHFAKAWSSVNPTPALVFVKDGGRSRNSTLTFGRGRKVEKPNPRLRQGREIEKPYPCFIEVWRLENPLRIQNPALVKDEEVGKIDPHLRQGKEL